MADYSPPLADIRFVLDHLVDLGGLAKLEPFGHADPDTVYGLLEEFGRFCAEVVAPLDRPGDRHGARHDPGTGTVTTPPGWPDAYAKLIGAGWSSVPFPEEYGGGGFPWLVGMALQEMLQSASLAFSIAVTLTQGAVDALLHHGSEEQKEQYLRRLVTGEWTGTMNLTEPHAGSDVGALVTKAVPAGDGTYRISGTKVFISYGEHDLVDQIVHLVLARTPDSPPGTKGISLFLVPRRLPGPDGAPGERNRITCVSIEHKLGLHASPTCMLSYEDAIGFLVGPEHGGMRAMFTMMNNARLSVGIEGLAIGERAYQRAVAHARERLQGRSPGAPGGTMSPLVDHADVRRMLLTMRSTIEAMRYLLYRNALAIDLARHGASEEIREREQERADLLTPLSKAWCTDMGLDLARLCTQVFGGMGFIEETGVAQYERDMRAAPIYEGTNGIQAIDLVTRKLPMRAGAAVEALLAEIAGTAAAAQSAGGDLSAAAAALEAGVAAAREGASWLLAALGDDVQRVLCGATPYLRLLASVVAAEGMVRQALIARRLLDSDEPGAGSSRGAGNLDLADGPGFLEAKVATARFFVEQLLPPSSGLLPAVTGGTELIFAIPPEHLASR